MATDLLRQEVEGLKGAGYQVEIVEADGVVNLIFTDFSIPPYYNKKHTCLLLRLPVSYPNGNPDMFWTDADLARPNGTTPTKADQIETYLGKQWRRFSWHPQGWNPGTGNLCMYLEFVNSGLIKAGKG
ncbi:MAG TPA: E2/UBC family protein [Oculatellaceae cyanobacterium]